MARLLYTKAPELVVMVTQGKELLEALYDELTAHLMKNPGGE